MRIYDIQGLAFGILMTSLGVVIFKAAGLVTGQTAGLALLLTYVLPVGFGTAFIGISLPFFALALSRKGLQFTLRTIVAVGSIALVSTLIQRLMTFESIDPMLAAILAGSCCGVGLIALFRHDASAGGLGTLALLVEEKTGFKAGWFQMGFDLCIFAAAVFVLPVTNLLVSLLGSAILNALIVFNFNTRRTA